MHCRICLGILLSALAGAAAADVYKCRTPAGKIEISATPCTPGSRTENVVADDPVSPARREEAERDLQRARTYVGEREEAQRREREADEKAAERQRQQAADNARNAQGASGGGATGGVVSGYPPQVIVVDPVARCRYAVEQQNLSPQKRQEALANCASAGTPVPTPPSKLGPSNACEAAADRVLSQSAKERRYANCREQAQRDGK